MEMKKMNQLVVDHLVLIVRSQVLCLVECLQLVRQKRYKLRQLYRQKGEEALQQQM